MPSGDENVVHERLRPSFPRSPDDSPWEGGTFNLRMKFSEEYPNKAPEVVFVSRLFHPNVYKDGRICLDILQSKWSPVNTVQAVLVSIQVRQSRARPHRGCGGQP